MPVLVGLPIYDNFRGISHVSKKIHITKFEIISKYGRQKPISGESIFIVMLFESSIFSRNL